jgi:hypothetical protein
MSVSIWVGEKSALQHFIKRGLNSGNHVARAKGSLLGFLEIIVRISIQYKFP